MTIDEAIKHCEEKACDNTACAIEHKQLAEWLEELKKYRNRDKDESIRKELLEHCKNQAKPYILTGNDCPQIQSWIAWLEKQGEQKPAEWSEEDEVMLNGCINVLREVGHKTLSNWLEKNMEKLQPKQEWSEEDEQITKRIDSLLYSIHENEFEDIHAWLKSLKDRYDKKYPQNQWKPNKEQMEALWNVYEGGEKQSALASLYSDLKKL